MIERDDRRANTAHPWGWVVFTDRFLSGMGRDCGRCDVSVYALAVADPAEAEVVLSNGRARSDMQRGRLVDGSRLPGRARRGEHVHVATVDRTTASRWYQPGAWRDY